MHRKLVMFLIMVYSTSIRLTVEDVPYLPTPITFKSGGFEKKAQKNLEIRTSNLETSKICVK